MLILGDYAYPFEAVAPPKSFAGNKNILLNCEGYLVETEEKDHIGVYNNINSFTNFDADYLILGLANNHVMDSPTGAVDSIKLVEKVENIKTVGAGKNLEEASKPLIVSEEGLEIAIIAAGWDVIGCKHAQENQAGVMPLDDIFITLLIKEQKQLGRKVLIYAHWGYELEIYPHPTHRNMAKKFVDAGADIVIGCHAHCLQGYEKYNNSYIFYGIGNSVFQQNYYFNRKLKFPDYCTSGLCIDWNPHSNTILVADIELDDNTIVVSDYIEPEKHTELNKLSTFKTMSKRQYIDFFKKNRIKKNLLPIFKEQDTTIRYKIKRVFVMLRAVLISYLFIIGLKGSSR